MREDNLLCLRRKQFEGTTDSNHSRSVYPNLAASMVVTDIDQLCVADITYIRLENEFVYLAVALDAHSRRVIGRARDRVLECHLAIAALQMAARHRSSMAEGSSLPVIAYLPTSRLYRQDLGLPTTIGTIVRISGRLYFQ